MGSPAGEQTTDPTDRVAAYARERPRHIGPGTVTKARGRSAAMFRGKKDTTDVAAYEVTKTDEEWKDQLSPERYAVLRRAATEPAWSGELLHVDGEGKFRCAGCGAELFDSDAKFDSGSGWPSFDRARAAGTIVERPDRSLGITRTEILCARCGGHLGHVFPDGPTDTGMRYCVNSLSLTYEPDSDDAETTRPARGD
jgi:methionine-R-sulfoxide reductase